MWPSKLTKPRGIAYHPKYLLTSDIVASTAHALCNWIFVFTCVILLFLNFIKEKRLLLALVIVNELYIITVSLFIVGGQMTPATMHYGAAPMHYNKSMIRPPMEHQSTSRY